MKFNFGKRVILFVYWLASMTLLALLVLPEYVGAAFNCVIDKIPAAYQQYALIALLAIYLLLSIAVLCMVFKRNAQKRADRGFITVDSADTGKVRIAISAIEHMVKQAAYTVDGIAEMKIGISNADDAIAIHVNLTMVNGSHVPTVTLNMQRAIRQYVEMNCGVAVQSVSISIQSVANPGEGGKRGRRSEAKIAAQPVQTQQPEIEQPVVAAETAPAAIPVEESPMPEIIEESAVAEAKDEESVIMAEAIEVSEDSEDFSDDEQNEEEKEN